METSDDEKRRLISETVGDTNQYVSQPERPEQTSATSQQSDIKYKIALVGETESGKSSFINAILRLEEGAPDAAGIGPERSEEVKHYPFRPNITLSDYPGLETAYSNTEAYFGSFSLNEIDGFLLFIKAKYSQTDKHLADKLCQIKKPFLIVMTKMDRAMPRRVIEAQEKKKIIEKFRQNALELFRSLNGCDAAEENKRIFLVDNHDPDNPNWDFGLLRKAILNMFQRADAAQKEEVQDNVDWDFIYLQEKIENMIQQPNETESFNMSDTEKRELKECRGLKEVQEKIGKMLKKWKFKEINVAVVGRSGTGKSSFINALRGLEFGHPQAAKTGTTEAAVVPTPYVFPKNPLVKIWELPGTHTPKLGDVESYCKKFKLKMFDAFVIIESERFKISDLKFVKKSKDTNKPVYFVRSKIGTDCQNEERTKTNYSETKLLKIIKDDLVESLKVVIKEKEELSKSIFLLSSHHPHKWDFPALVTAIRNNLPEDKKKAFIFSTDIFSEGHLEVKVKELKGMIWKVALMSLKEKFMPGKDSQKYNLEVIKECVGEYLEQFNLPLNADSNEFKKLPEYLQKEMKKFYCTKEELTSYLETATKPSIENLKQKFGDKIGEPDEYPWLFKSEISWHDFVYVRCSLKCLLDKIAKVRLTIFFPETTNTHEW